MVKLKLDQEKEKGQFSLTIITYNLSPPALASSAIALIIP